MRKRGENCYLNKTVIQSVDTGSLSDLGFHFSNFCGSVFSFSTFVKVYSSLKAVVAAAATSITSGLCVHLDTEPGRPAGHGTEPFPWVNGGAGGGVVPRAKCCSKNLPDPFEASGLNYVNGEKIVPDLPSAYPGGLFDCRAFWLKKKK